MSPGQWSSRTVVGPGDVVDAHRQRWKSATGFTGGDVIRLPQQVKGTSSPALYRDVRLGVQRWSESVPSAGTYAVDLFIVEPTEQKSGRRVFSVKANGRAIASRVDPYGQAGLQQAMHVIALVPVSGSKLTLDFAAEQGEPVISAIQVEYQRAALTDKLAWSDDFNGAVGSAVNDKKWTHETGGGGWGNQEAQSYTADTKNSYLDGQGHLVIAAVRGHYTGSDGNTEDWTSARISTQGRFQFRYGTVTARIRVPTGTGLWPAFWAIGADEPSVGWPASGELDVMESYGDPALAVGTVHSPDSATKQAQFQCKTSVKTSSGGYADYSALWTPIGIQISVNGDPYCWAVPADYPATTTWVMNKPFYLLLNLAVRGAGNDRADDTTPSPAMMLVDRVRVFQ